ncbi:MAG: bifunctional glutathionylspermidine amidase/synthase [Gammaproteobacteria bacterium]|nr:bifunctional glutathionylspermidine amidase/synthase [Pseudomonadales bacterium]
MEPSPLPKEKFGSVIGIAPGNVPVYSCDYESADDSELPTRQAYRSYCDGIYMGHKWQCVEFARRWLYVNYGYVFDDIAMAHDIFRLKKVRHIRDNTLLPLRSFRNGSLRHPQPGCLLIYDEGGEFEMTGHVAVITEVGEHYVRIAEQNVGDQMWPDGQQYSRQIHAEVTADGEFWLECSFGDATILGWVIQTDNDEYAELIEPPDPALFSLVPGRVIPKARDMTRSWLNVANPDEAAYVAMMGGHKLSARPQDEFLYYVISETALAELRRATNELHALYMHATDYVLRDDKLQEAFNIPSVLWPKIQQSWANRRNQMITGRFDFAMTRTGLKVYEYNCDSASCHMETGKVQGRWARHYGCKVGYDPGRDLHRQLRDAWRHSDVNGLVHIMQDNDAEETYHALFMREAMEQAGIESRILHGVSGLRWADDGAVLDPEGNRIKWVWKTWAWETALDQIREECDNDTEKLQRYRPGEVRQGAPRLVDVLLRSEVMVYEPLWTLIPSNKAISPILWAMFPDYPYLLESSFDLTGSLRSSGYVIKPIVGRGGANIIMLDSDANLLVETAGKFDNREQIYQQLFGLPRSGDYFVQLSTFTAAGRYAASCIRIDESPVITMKSDNLCLRVVEDDFFPELLADSRETGSS